MKHYTLKAEKRELTGRKVKRLRLAGIIPGTVYGKAMKSETVQVNEKELIKVYNEAGETGIVDIELASKKHPSLISNIQVHPVTSNVLHVDFREVDLTKKVKAMVPVELVGESPAEKQGMGTAVLMVDEVEVEALPEDLPEKFEIDATVLVEVEQTFTVAHLKSDKKVEILTAGDQILAKVEPPQKEEVVEVAPVEGEAAPEGEAKAEAPAETETPKAE